MSLPLKDLPLCIRESTHRKLSRVSKSRKISMSEIGREIIEAYVREKIHESKVWLGLDDGDLEQGELDLGEGESHRIARSGRK